MPNTNEATASSSITITILYFAGALTATRTPSETLKLPVKFSLDGPEDNVTINGGFPLSALSAFLVEKYAGTNLEQVLRNSQWSVDAEMVESPESVTLRGGEEVAVIPPVSGG